MKFAIANSNLIAFKFKRPAGRVLRQATIMTVSFFLASTCKDCDRQLAAR